MARQRFSDLAALFLLVVLACTGDPAKSVSPGTLSANRSELAGNLGNPGVLPPQSHAFGETYAERLADAWQFIFKVPVPDNPALDATGAKCRNGQTGHVWFLAALASAVRTECVVPSGTALFVLGAGAECSNVEGFGTTAAELRACAQAFADGGSDVAVDVDGMAIQDVPRYRVQSAAFNFAVPDNNLFQAFGIAAPAGSCYPSAGACVPYLSVADGHAFLLAPLAPGSHTIHLHAAFPHFTSDVVYELKVEDDDR